MLYHNAITVVLRCHTDDVVGYPECGRKFKSLKRHLRTYHNLTPVEYRNKWGLPANYPMVAANYSEKRAELAKKIGLGNRRTK